jgi:hypothetical protein
MDEGAPRYAFDPLERRGLLFGLRPTQIALTAAAMILAWAALRALPAPAGSLLALMTATAGTGSALWSKDGQTVAAWGMLGLRWVARRLRGPLLSEEPLDGVSGRTPVSRGRRSAPAAGLQGVDLVGLPAEPGQPAVGVIVDRTAGRLVAVVPALGASFSLLDPDDQASRLDSWRLALNSLARPGTPVRRVQWVELSAPEDGCTRVPLPRSECRRAKAVDSYFELVASASAGALTHQVWLVVAVEGPDPRSAHGGRRAADTIRRELRLLEGQLRNAGVLAPGPLDEAALSSVLRAAHATEEPRAGSSMRRAFGPMADEEGWSAYRADGTWHATYWIAEWPRIEVGPDFMSPLLLSGGRRAVSVVMEPVAPERAAREVRSARTSDAAEEQLRATAGFTPNARRGKEAEAALRREDELADGHAEFRFSGYVTVSAADRAALDLACAETEHAAQGAHLEIRRLYGRQREAFTWTLPLARGLR